MKTSNTHRLTTGILLASLAGTHSHAQSLTVVTISGGNGSSAWAWNQVTNFFGGSGTVKTVGSTSSTTVRSFQGYLASLPGTSPNVELDFILNGSVGGLQDLTNGNVETNAGGGDQYSHRGHFQHHPRRRGLEHSSGFTEVKSLVTPYAYHHAVR